jgi:hypothetical protein
VADRMDIITPKEFVGTLMELAQQRRGEYVDMLYLTEARTTLVYDLPLAEVQPPTPQTLPFRCTCSGVPSGRRMVCIVVPTRTSV